MQQSDNNEVKGKLACTMKKSDSSTKMLVFFSFTPMLQYILYAYLDTKLQLSALLDMQNRKEAQ